MQGSDVPSSGSETSRSATRFPNRRHSKHVSQKVIFTVTHSVTGTPTALIGLFNQFDVPTRFPRQGDATPRTDFVSVHVRYLTSALGTFRRSHIFYVTRIFNKYTPITGFRIDDSEVSFEERKVRPLLPSSVRYTGSSPLYGTSIHVLTEGRRQLAGCYPVLYDSSTLYSRGRSHS